MSSSKPSGPILPVTTHASLPPAYVADPRLTLALWASGGLRVSELLRMSTLRVSEIYGATDEDGTLAERVRARLRSYRSHLADTVVRASPLLLDAVASSELGLALEEMAPPPSFPSRLSTGIGWMRLWRSPQRVLLGETKHRTRLFLGRTKLDAAFAQPFRCEGHVLRFPSHPLGGVGVRPVGDCLEIAMLIRGVLIVTLRCSVRVIVPTPLPETVAIAARSRLLSELIDHQLFNGRDYRIRNVSVKDGMSIFTATAPSEAYDLRKV